MTVTLNGVIYPSDVERGEDNKKWLIQEPLMLLFAVTARPMPRYRFVALPRLCACYVVPVLHLVRFIFLLTLP